MRPQVSRYTVLIFGALMGVLSIILNEIGLNLGWVYLFMGVVIGSAVVPVSMVLTWKKATAKGVIAGALLGQICAIIAWLVRVAFQRVLCVWLSVHASLSQMRSPLYQRKEL